MRRLKLILDEFSTLIFILAIFVTVLMIRFLVIGIYRLTGSPLLAIIIAFGMLIVIGFFLFLKDKTRKI
ncbi:hypothetical protein VFC49_05640 [Thermococcus sp. SY098]|uniref:hypothetical protein n=1 Tax=Thermococcus sp. SY098 TaxID=3111325 RepID=UPI002D78EF49|nr:hypothetical protein [Thermococcus sp. SY098]WRS53579.1 hypothetical protein VFC49_05640 [Thermococcus sp. SY098]